MLGRLPGAVCCVAIADHSSDTHSEYVTLRVGGSHLTSLRSHNAGTKGGTSVPNSIHGKLFVNLNRRDAVTPFRPSRFETRWSFCWKIGQQIQE